MPVFVGSSVSGITSKLQVPVSSERFGVVPGCKTSVPLHRIALPCMPGIFQMCLLHEGDSGEKYRSAPDCRDNAHTKAPEMTGITL